MGVMEWLARYSDFLTGEMIYKCINAFKDIYNTDNATLRNAFIYANTNSNVVLTLM
jgi:hypothetical protein